MAKRSTRNKVRLQAWEAWQDLKRGQDHLVHLYAIAEERGEYINENLPIIVTALEEVMRAVERFNEGL